MSSLVMNARDAVAGDGGLTGWRGTYFFFLGLIDLRSDGPAPDEAS